MMTCGYCGTEVGDDLAGHLCPLPDLQDFFAVVELAAQAGKEGRLRAAETIFSSARFLLPPCNDYSSDNPLRKLDNGVGYLSDALQRFRERRETARKWNDLQQRAPKDET